MRALTSLNATTCSFLQFDAAGLDVNVKGDIFLDTFNFSEGDLPRDIVALFAIYVGLLVAAYVHFQLSPLPPALLLSPDFR